MPVRACSVHAGRRRRERGRRTFDSERTSTPSGAGSEAFAASPGARARANQPIRLVGGRSGWSIPGWREAQCAPDLLARVRHRRSHRLALKGDAMERTIPTEWAGQRRPVQQNSWHPCARAVRSGATNCTRSARVAPHSSRCAAAARRRHAAHRMTSKECSCRPR
jgi:hypothetical protein